VGVAAVESFLIFGKDISRKGAKTQSKTQTEKISHAKTQRRKARRKQKRYLTQRRKGAKEDARYKMKGVFCVPKLSQSANPISNP
jgi:hypothetical protein